MLLKGLLAIFTGNFVPKIDRKLPEKLVRHGGPKPEENRRSIYQHVLHKLTLNKLGLKKL